ncbi:putative DNA endonuclease SmrA [Candidatus Kinetoplastibacterium sorsogonicusi]|uniref:Putative DNA endonuclease SmrA n=1 Tax=Candidatus Kinetoplastidibacterium kentomonadis TaxID=1576550 RepID=A0A3S7JAA5_9PROT|nr:Smr/MutS family protein [Candidatus Kinetoplastibacterium sorsogonicusi]AWD32610.1 putative DNA endonuclease SmrA [Candidatus Kinetoplastibacterium sorsogonicusi]
MKVNNLLDKKINNTILDDYKNIDKMSNLVGSVIPLKPKFKEYLIKHNSKNKKNIQINDLDSNNINHYYDNISDEVGISHLLSEEGDYIRQKDSKDLLKKLKKSFWKIQNTLDLHGMYKQESKQAVIKFLKLSYQDRLRCIKIIHGKGYGSYYMKPVLKNMVKVWLIQIEEVQAFSSASKFEGGDGSLIVLLKKWSENF